MGHYSYWMKIKTLNCLYFNVMLSVGIAVSINLVTDGMTKI
jgi:hypothetical protein